MWPRPVQQPHPPIWVPVVGSQESIEFAGRQLCVLDELDRVGAPLGWDSRRHAHARGVASGKCLGDRSRQCGGGDATHVRAIVANAIAQQIDSRRAVASSSPAVGARRGCRGDRLRARAANAGEDQLA